MDHRNSKCYDESLVLSFKLIDNEAIEPTSVLNLSSHLLTENEVQILSKGLKFIPKPLKAKQEDVTQALEEFSRRVKLTGFFGSFPEDYQSKSRTKRLFVHKSEWNPPENDIIQDQLDVLKNEVSKLEVKQNRKKNLSPKEYKALKSLRNNRNIVIKPADKGATVVIMDKARYVNEGNRQLLNPNYYQKINEPIHPRVKEKLNSTLDKLHKGKFLTKRQLEYLEVQETTRDRLFYMLPKIHKERAKWTDDSKNPPGRPIVSDCNSDTYAISEYIDHFLKPLATQHPSYVKDTQDFLEKLRNIKISPNSLLITLDVDSLYTNIDNEAGLEAVIETFENNADLKRPDDDILSLLKICLKHNDFIFNKEWYLQVGGTAMGKKFAPNYANIFMAKWEKEALDKCPKSPQCYFRYLDDIFIIWPHSKEDFVEFFNILNSHHPNIKLKSTVSENSIAFLDVMIFKGDNFQTKQTLDTKVFFKPTDTHELLHKTSYHPSHTFKGIIKSQIIRFRRICTNDIDFHQACNTLFAVLRTRGYSYSSLRKIKRDTIYGLNPTGSAKRCGKPTCKTCRYITETDRIPDKNNNPIALKDNLNCQSMGVVYAIECTNCGKRYVGETRQKLKDRLNQHRSDIKTLKDTAVATHFTKRCPSVKFLRITPIEEIKQIIPDEYNYMRLTNPIDILQHLRREDVWIKKLGTIAPHGLNLRQEMPPPIPFVITYSDVTSKISRLAKKTYAKIQERLFSKFLKTELVVAYKRNRNLRDLLVKAPLA